MQYIYFVLVKGGDNTSVKYVCRHQFSYIFLFFVRSPGMSKHWTIENTWCGLPQN